MSIKCHRSDAADHFKCPYQFIGRCIYNIDRAGMNRTGDRKLPIRRDVNIVNASVYRPGFDVCKRLRVDEE